MKRSAAPSQLATSLGVKRKSKSDDEEEDRSTKTKTVTSSNDWAKLRENLKKSKNKAHDNYDASNFISPFRKPLTNLNNNLCDSGTKLDKGINSNNSNHHV